MFKLFRLFGINVYLHWSLILLFLLFFFAGVSVGAPTYMAFIAAAFNLIICTVSILAHEFSHSLVAIKYKMPIKYIRMFFFGGQAHMGKERFDSPKAEALTAIAGPAMSLVISAVFFGLSYVVSLTFGDSGKSVNELLQVVALFNLIVGLFNGTLPFFPLDFGRVLRAIIWHKTKNYYKATRFVVKIGIIGGYLLILLGLGVVVGIIGGFLSINMAGVVSACIIGVIIIKGAQNELRRMQ